MNGGYDFEGGKKVHPSFIKVIHTAPGVKKRPSEAKQCVSF